MPLILALAGASTNKVTNSRLLASMACDNKVFPMRSCKSYRIGLQYGTHNSKWDQNLLQGSNIGLP